MLINTTGYDIRNMATGEVSHVDTTIDTRDLHWGKYDSGMAVYLDSLALESGEDDWAGDGDIGESVLRFGKWTLTYTSQGFVIADKWSDVAMAEKVMQSAHSQYDDTDDYDSEGEDH